jgi:hypothetical protein
MRAVAAKLAKNGNGQVDDFEELSIQQIALRCGLDRATTKKRLDQVGEFIDVVQRLFGAMHKEIAVRMPKRLAARLAKAKNPAEISKILSADLNKTFNDLREDHSKFLGK